MIDGSLHGYARTGIAGVSNVGTDRNWTGSQFNQANWYAFGRLAWDPIAVVGRHRRRVDSHDVLERRRRSWRRSKRMMMTSREAVVNYMTPLGLAHIMATGHHYGPGPWVSRAGRTGRRSTIIAPTRSASGSTARPTGSNAVAQYFPPRARALRESRPYADSLLLWFHHVGWTERLRSGRTLWDELVRALQRRRRLGARDAARVGSRCAVRSTTARFADVTSFLAIQEHEARWWRDAALQYFQQFRACRFRRGTSRRRIRWRTT